MSLLSEKDKNLVFDLYFDCLDENQAQQARALIASNKQAQELYDQLTSKENALNKLNELAEAEDICPEYLANSTLEKLKSTANQRENIRLTELLEVETGKIPLKVGLPKRIMDFTAVAAGLIIIAAVYFPAVSNMRHKSWLNACQSNMASIAGGIGSYANDNDGQLPSVSMKNNTPWWKVGYQGKENFSNTRRLWKLVLGKYVKPGAFVCPGRSSGRAISLDNQNISHLLDFPGRKYITYSSRLAGGKPDFVRSRTIFIADSNPIFEKIDHKNNSHKDLRFKVVELCEKLKRRNSANHRRLGQNVMFTDGSVKFFRVRVLSSGDDIYTIKGTNVYTGCEGPANNTDVFLVP